MKKEKKIDKSICKKYCSKNEAAITLVALIVTIIVLLILAGVTIANITGNQGTISRSKNVTSNYNQRKVEEQLTMIMQEYGIEDTEKGTTLSEFLEYKKTNEKVIDGYKINENGSVDIIKDKYLVSFDNNLTIIDCMDRSILPKDTDTMIYHFENIPEEAIDFTVTEDNREKIGFKGTENEILTIPCAFKDEDGKWYKIIGFKSGCFQETNVKDVTLPYGITEIPDGMFYRCEKLSSIKAFDGITIIGIGSFRGCTNLTSISLPNTVTVINSGAFNECTNLKSVVFSKSIETIKSGSFAQTGLTEINLPNSIKLIETGAFWCENVQTININYENLEIQMSGFFIGQNTKKINIIGNILKTSSPFYVENGENIEVILKSQKAELNGALLRENDNKISSIKSANIICDELKASGTFNSSKAPIENLILDCNKATFENSTITGSSVKNLYFNGTKSKWQQFDFKSGWIALDAVNVVHCTDGDLTLY